MILEKLFNESNRQATAYHWLFEAGDGVPEELILNKEVFVSSSYSCNPIGKGGAVEVLKYLHHYKTPLKRLELKDTGVGEEDCAHAACSTH